MSQDLFDDGQDFIDDAAGSDNEKDKSVLSPSSSTQDVTIQSSSQPFRLSPSSSHDSISTEVPPSLDSSILSRTLSFEDGFSSALGYLNAAQAMWAESDEEERKKRDKEVADVKEKKNRAYKERLDGIASEAEKKKKGAKEALDKIAEETEKKKKEIKEQLEKIKSDLKKNEQEREENDRKRAKNEQENQELTASKIKLVDEYKKLCHKK